MNMEEKLKLKHLAPYLPYGLMVMTKWRKDGKFNKPKILRGQDLDVLKNSKNLHIKPLLHPLSRLTSGMLAYYSYSSRKKFEEDVKHEFVQALILDDLIKQHYDVFGLIEKGLALPIDPK